MVILDALKLIGDLETKIAHLYGWFAEKMESDAEAAEFFTKMSEDEQSHVYLVKFQARLFDPNDPNPEQIEIDGDQIKNMIENIETFINENPNPELKDALDFAIEIEGSVAERHYRQALGIKNKKIAELVEKLSVEDGHHNELLGNFMKKRC